MAKPNRELTIHRCILDCQAKKVLQVVNAISEKDSLNTCDIQAIRTLMDVYESLTNPIQEMKKLHQVNCSNGHCAELQ